MDLSSPTKSIVAHTVVDVPELQLGGAGFLWENINAVIDVLVPLFVGSDPGSDPGEQRRTCRGAICYFRVPQSADTSEEAMQPVPHEGRIHECVAEQMVVLF